MLKETKTFIRVREGADNAQIDNCTASIHEGSDRSFVDTAAKDTHVTNSRIIEITKNTLRKGCLILLSITILGAASDLISLLADGRHLWEVIFKN